jgi:large subunit ribosomal protein L43
MATRGVFQCQRLTLYYCEHGGSSSAVRSFLAGGRLLEWARERPTVQIQVRVRNGKHPYVKADYLTQAVAGRRGKDNRAMPVLHQISLKSKHPHDEYVQNVEDTLDQLYNKSGRKMTKFTRPVYTDTPSIQGVWTPSLNLHLEPEFELKIIES